jgi:ParB-like chromosome segregation protein Spo0J
MLVDINKLYIDEEDGRKVINIKYLIDLSNNIKVNGLQRPLIIEPNGRIISGFNRFLACKLLGHKQIKCLIKETQ